MSKRNIHLENIDFSDTAKQMDALKAALFDINKTNERKIQFIKEELANGRYEIHPHHIAEHMLEYTPTHVMESEVELA
jgi:negative regulator of flagellin synthesis FlgM